MNDVSIFGELSTRQPRRHHHKLGAFPIVETPGEKNRSGKVVNHVSQSLPQVTTQVVKGVSDLDLELCFSPRSSSVDLSCWYSVMMSQLSRDSSVAEAHRATVKYTLCVQEERR